jgi:hypothetical protein
VKGDILSALRRASIFDTSTCGIFVLRVERCLLHPKDLKNEIQLMPSSIKR